MERAYNTEAIRALLLSAFDAGELDHFLFDHFRNVHAETQGQPRGARAQELVAHCERQGRVDELLSFVKQANDYQYRRYELRIAPSPTESAPPTKTIRRKTRHVSRQPLVVAHSAGDETLAASVSTQVEAGGYAVLYCGTLLDGDELAPEAEAVLRAGGPLVLCATLRSVGRTWGRQVAERSRRSGRCRRFTVLFEEELAIESLESDEIVDASAGDTTVWGPVLVEALKKYYAPTTDDTGRGERRDIERRYRELALDTFDIVDLANMPEGDRHLATRKLELRRLYVPLRARIEIVPENLLDKESFAAIEKRRAKQIRGELGEDSDSNKRVSVGERLSEVRRLVVLGDPGAGKSTLLRWMATAYLLRLQQHPDLGELPDVGTLPSEDLLPILVRCRDLEREHLRGSLDGILSHVLRKAEMSEKETKALRDVLLGCLGEGSALLLIDGLDEITDPGVRSRFCGQIEQISRRYEKARIVVTSRIVGYREMGRRIGRSFEHLTVAELSKEDKDDFVRRWATMTEPAERRERATDDLIHDIHSADRIERLTGNPMLLTTMALVKRKVGKLPSRRADLYGEAVQVLLNWRSEVDEPLDYRETVPQLEYLAYAMCERGVQRLREDEVLELFEQFRTAYPNVHDARNHAPAELLRLLESRAGILVAAGEERHRGRRAEVVEFRHLTFQEYLAGLALVDSFFPGYDRSRTLAAHVAPLAGRVGEEQGEVAVVENWREALRLCVTTCNAADVDDVLMAILTPLPSEDAEVTARPRAVLAALALADEPVASAMAAQQIIETLAKQVPKDRTKISIGVPFVSAAIEVARSLSAAILRKALMNEYLARHLEERVTVGSVLGYVLGECYTQDPAERQAWLHAISTTDEDIPDTKLVDSLLGIMQLSYLGELSSDPGLPALLLAMLHRSAPVALAAAWALGWLGHINDFSSEDDVRWQPGAELQKINTYLVSSTVDLSAAGFLSWVIERVNNPDCVPELMVSLAIPESNIQQAAAKALEKIGDARAVEGLVQQLSHSDRDVRLAVVTALGQISGERAVDALIPRLDDLDAEVCQYVIAALGNIGDKRAVDALIPRLGGSDSDIQLSVIEALGNIGDERAVDTLIPRLGDSDSDIQLSVIEALGNIGGERAIDGLLARLDDPKASVRQSTIAALGNIGGERAFETILHFLADVEPEVRRETVAALAKHLEDEQDTRLLSQDLDALTPWLDPQEPITAEQVDEAAHSLSLTAEEVRRRYEALAGRFKLKLEWLEKTPAA